VKKAPVLPKSVQNLRKDRRVMSTDDEGGSRLNRKTDASDMWVEVWSDVEEQWICIDLFKGKLHCVDTIRVRIYQAKCRALHPVIVFLFLRRKMQRLD